MTARLDRVRDALEPILPLLAVLHGPDHPANRLCLEADAEGREQLTHVGHRIAGHAVDRAVAGFGYCTGLLLDAAHLRPAEWDLLAEAAEVFCVVAVTAGGAALAETLGVSGAQAIEGAARQVEGLLARLAQASEAAA